MPAPLLLRGNALSLPLADASVDLIVTSPPYFGLRSYQDGGEHYDGQIGAEASPRQFIEALIDCTREMVRVLKPTGSIFVNLGDKYSGSAGGGPPSAASTLRGNGHVGGGPKQQAGAGRQTGRVLPGRAKSLMLLPERYRIAAVDELGLIARAVLVWSKPNAMPESVTDRVRRAHEDWVHLTKTPRYFSAVDEIREPSTQSDSRGRVPGSVWEIATQPLRVPAELGIDHFAAFPMEWPRRVVEAWCPREICTVCGQGRAPVSERTTVFDKARDQAHAAEIATRGAAHAVMSGGTARSTLNGTTTRTITGYACACSDTTAPSKPGVVLDPFGGAGTTALVASMLGRVGISVDLSADYGRLAAWRCSDPKEQAKAAHGRNWAAAMRSQSKNQTEKVTELTPREADQEKGLALHDGRHLPTTADLRTVLREGLDAVQAEEWEKRGGAEVAKPEDAYALLRRYGAMAEVGTDYMRAFADFVKELKGRAGDELSIMYGEQDGVPNSDAAVPDIDGTTIKVQRDHANSYSFDLDSIISAAVIGMMADPEVNEALAAMFQAEFSGDAETTVKHLSWVLGEAVRRVLATGKFEAQVTKVKALAKAAAIAGDDQLASTVTGAIKKTTVLKGIKITREQPKEK